MFLSDGTLLSKGSELIHPFNPLFVQPCSVDLSIDQTTSIYPHQFKLISTYEVVTVPLDLGARVEGKSTWGRRGLFVHVSAGWIDPGFQGTITLELYNASTDLIEIQELDSICQIAFFQLDKPAIRGYNGKYQNQSGATGPRV